MGILWAMSRFYFDVRDGDVLLPDEDGMEALDIDAAESEAIRTLLSIVKDLLDEQALRQIAIEVRDEVGPVLVVSSVWKVQRKC